MEKEVDINHNFRIMLRPYMDLFEFKKATMPAEEWMAFVNRTKTRVINNPEQFLGNELPPGLIIGEAIESIFSEYFAEESSLA